MTFEILIELRNGQSHSFFKNASSKEEIIQEATNTHGNGWYHFISKEYVKYQVLKSEIVSIGISLNAEEAKQFENTFTV